MVSRLNHVDKAFIFKSQCELCHVFFSVCCYTQNLLGNKINCIKNVKDCFFCCNLSNTLLQSNKIQITIDCHTYITVQAFKSIIHLKLKSRTILVFEMVIVPDVRSVFNGKKE